MIAEHKRQSAPRQLNRCTWCGLPVHGTKRGKLRCATRAFAIARALAPDTWHSQPSDRFDHPYRAPEASRHVA